MTGVGKNSYRIIRLGEVFAALRQSKAAALPGLHTLGAGATTLGALQAKAS